MKIALHYSGMLRTFKYCYPQTLNLMNNYDVDIFLSLWDIPGHSFKYKKNPTMAYPDIDYKEITKELILNEYSDLNIKGIEIESFEKSKKIMAKMDLKHCLNEASKEISSEYYKIKKVNVLRENYEKQNNIKYDWYMRLRPDVSIEKFPDILNINRDTLFLNKYVWESPSLICFKNNQLSGNTFWLTNSKKINDILSKAYDKRLEYYDEKMYGENFMGKLIIRNNLLKYLKLFDFEIKILRSHGYSQYHGRERTWN